MEEQGHLEDAVELFKIPNRDSDAIYQAGVKCILSLYDAPKSAVDLNLFRHQYFTKAIVKDARAQLVNLPCTADAAMEHLKKVYLQVQSWLGNYLQPIKWR